MLINPVFGYIVQVMDAGGFKFAPVSEPIGVEGETVEVIIKGIATGSGEIRFTLSTDEIYRYDWTYPNTAGVIDVEKGKEYELRANLYSHDDSIIGNDAYHEIRCRANTGGLGDDTSTTFYLHTIDDDAQKNNTPFLNPFTIFGIILVVVILLNRQKGDTK